MRDTSKMWNTRSDKQTMTPFYSRIVTFLLFLTSGHSFLHLCDGFVSQCSTTPTRLPRSVCLSPPIPSRDEVRRCIGIRDQRSYAVLSLSLSPDSNSSNIKRDETSSSLPTLLDPGTKGGVIVLGTLLFIVPFLIYSVLTSTGTLNEEDAGRFVGVGFTIFTSLLWVSTYIFRVATKDMTYAKQLKDYENAVIQKRLEELEEDEVQAMLEDIEREQREEKEAF